MLLEHHPRRTIGLACCAVVIASSLVATGPAAAAPDPAAGAGAARAGDALARSALEGALRRSNSRAVEVAVRRARRDLADRAARTPHAVGSASLVLADGLTAASAADLVTGRGLELISAEAKTPVGGPGSGNGSGSGSGQVVTMWFNDFELLDGTLPQKLERAVGKARFRNLRQADAAPSASKGTLRELATADIRFYRLDVAASFERLAALADDPAVVAVLPDADDRKVTAMRQVRAKVAAGRRAGPTPPPVRLVAGDPTRNGFGTPVLTNSGERCRWRPSDGALACQPAAHRPVSGDPVVDSALPRRDGEFAAGTTEAAAEPATGPAAAPMAAQDTNAFTDCNVPSNTEGCPNDFTYSPRPQTSGSQSFAVLVNSYPGGTVVFYDCYIVWVPGNGGSPNDGGSWQTVCYPYTVTSPAFTYGAAAWRSTWGTQTTTVAPNDTRPVSTLAFKASDLNRCDVDQFGATAECDRSDQNAIYVPDPGIEDELLIDNPACTGTRNGTTSDWNQGCFYPTLAQSNLPSAFLDTTFEDGASPYNLAVGSANPAAIAEGTPYTNYAEFFSYGFNNMLGRQASHAVSVDARVNLSAACAFGVVRGEADAFCYFPVDSVRVSERITFTTT